MSCRLSWNGKESVLHLGLTQKYGTDIADRVMTYIDSDQFYEKYGDYKYQPLAIVGESALKRAKSIDFLEAGNLRGMVFQSMMGIRYTADVLHELMGSASTTNAERKKGQRFAGKSLTEEKKARKTFLSKPKKGEQFTTIGEIVHHIWENLNSQLKDDVNRFDDQLIREYVEEAMLAADSVTELANYIVANFREAKTEDELRAEWEASQLPDAIPVDPVGQEPTLEWIEETFKDVLEKRMNTAGTENTIPTSVVIVGTNGIPNFRTGDNRGLDYAAYQKYAEEHGYTYPLRKGGDEHFGNPFSDAGKGKTINMGSVAAAVQAYKDWVNGQTDFVDKFGKTHKNVKPAQQKWIQAQVKSGAYKGKPILYWKNLGEPSHADAMAELFDGDTRSKTPLEGELRVPSDFEGQSGGAKGYDAEWHLIGQELGFVNFKHYLLPSDGAVADERLRAQGVQPVDATSDVGEIATKGDAIGEGQVQITNAERQMGRIEKNHVTRNTKKIRNWAQVKNADGVYAIGSLIPKGAPIEIARGKNVKTALIPQVSGGTSGAVQMGINNGKKVFVFNQVANDTYPVGWYTWDSTKKDFVPTDTPQLTLKFAAVGTSSNTTEIGKQAIRDVYKVTMEKGPLQVVGQIKRFDKTAILTLPSIDYKNRVKQVDRDYLSMKTMLREKLIDVASANPTTEYTLAVADPKRSSRPDNYGFTQLEYAYMLDEIRMEMGDEFPSNIVFPTIFEMHMFNNPTRLFNNIMQDYSPENRKLWALDQHTMREIASKSEVKVADANGVIVESFSRLYSPQLQLDAVDTLMNYMYTVFLRDKTRSADALINTALTRAQANLLEARTLGKTDEAERWEAVVYSFAHTPESGHRSFLHLLLERFNSLGYKISPRVANELLAKYSVLKFNMQRVKDINIPITVEERSYMDTLEEQVDNLDTSTYDNSLLADLAEGMGITDWSKSSFEVNPKDTASVRLKMWLSNQNMMKYGPNGLEPVLNGFKSEVKVNFDKLFSAILGNVSSIPDLTPERIVKILTNSNNPDLIQTGMNLELATEQIQNEFCKVMKLQYAEWIIVKGETPEEGAGLTGRIIHAQRSSQKRVIIDQWKSQYTISRMVKRKENGDRVMDVARAQVHYGFIQAYSLLSKYQSTDDIEKKLLKLDPVKDALEIADINARLEVVNAENAILQMEFGKLRDKYKFQSLYNGTLRELHEDYLGERAPEPGDKFIRRDRKNKRARIAAILKSMFEEYNILLHENAARDMVKTYVKDYVPALMDEYGYQIVPASGTETDFITKLTKGTSMEGGFLDQFRTSEQGAAKGMFSAFFGKASGAFANLDLDTEYSQEDEAMVMANNPLYTEDTTMKLLAGLQANHSDALYTINHSNSEGKSIWDFSLNTELSIAMQEFTSDPKAFIEELKGNILIGKDLHGSYYAKFWEKNPTKLPKLKYLDALLINNAVKGRTRTNMSGREQYLASLLMFQNSGRDVAHYMSVTHSDKTMTPVFYNIPKLSVGSVTNSGITDSVQIELAKIFVAEFKRIHKHQTVIDTEGTTGSENFDAGGKYFYFFQDFNKDKLAKVNPELFAMLYEENGRVKKPTPELLQKALPKIKSVISSQLQRMIDTTIESWKRSGLQIEHMDGQYLNKLHETLDNVLEENGLATYGNYASLKSLIERKDNAAARATMDTRNDMILRHAAKEYVINNWLWNVNSAILFYGDPAEAWNAAKHKTVDQALAEYAKRLAKDIAPGQDLTWKEEEQTYRTVVLEDVTETFKDGMDKDEKAKGTDAQEIVTVREHLTMLKAAGLLDPDIYETMVGIIDASWALPKDDPNRGNYDFPPSLIKRFKDDCKQRFTPQKPVFAGRRKPDRHGFAMHDYVKSSAYPLLPEYTRNTEMDKLRKWMEENNIARAVYASGKKLGGPTKPLQFFKNGVGTPPASVDEHVQIHDRKHLRIQQEVPFDADKAEIKLVSQMNKLIVAGIGDIESGFMFEGGNYSGKQMRQIKEDLRSQMYRNALDDLMTSLGGKKDEKGEWGAVSKKALISRLVQMARDKNYSENEIQLLEAMDGNGNFEFPPFLHTAVEKFESLMLSLVGTVSDVQVFGKSFVQSSSTGYHRDKVLDEADIDRRSLVFVGDYNGEPLKHIRVENGVWKPAQVFAPFDFKYTDENGNIVHANINAFLLKPGEEGYEENKKRLNMAKLPVELLQMVGARIPNQGHVSMIPVEIVAFLPDTLGDNIAVPSAITWQMGSDFDVDKLFCYRRPYKYENGNFVVHKDLENPNSDFEIKRKYMELHWSILSHPDMRSRILSGLDKPDMKNAAERYAPKEVNNFWSPTTQLDMFLSGKDAKILVALTSLSVTFNAVIEDKDLKLGGYSQVKGKLVPNPTSIYLNGLSLSRLSGSGSYNGYTKAINHTIIQNGALDNAKDRYMDNLNITLATYPAIAALHQLEDVDGRIVPASFTLALMVQDILKEFSEEVRVARDSLSLRDEDEDNSSANVSDAVYEAIKTRWEAKLSALLSEVGEDFEYDNNPSIDQKVLDEMFDAKDKNTANYLAGQIKVLEQFKSLLDVGNRMAQLQRTLNQDTRGAGPSMLYAMRQQDSYDQIIQSTRSTGILNESDLLRNTEQAVAFNSVVPTALKLGAIIFPVDAMKRITSLVATMQGKEYSDLSLATQQKIVRHMRSALLGSSPTLSMNSGFKLTDDMNRKERIRLQMGAETLAIRLERYKMANLGNVFTNNLQTSIHPSGKGPDTIRFKNSLDAKAQHSTIVGAFRDMLMSKDPEVVTLAEDLIKYAFLLSPQNGPSSYITYIPSDALLVTDFSRSLKSLVNKLRTDDVLFGRMVEQVVQHMPILAFSINNGVLALNSETNKITDRDYPEVLTLKRDTRNKVMIPMEPGSFVTTPAFYLTYYSRKDGKQILYRLQSAPDGDYIQYQRVDTLGTKNETEYDLYQGEIMESIYPENRAMHNYKPADPITALKNSINREIAESPAGQDHLASWGLHGSSSEGSLNMVMNRIAADREVPTYLRLLARTIKPFNATNTVIRFGGIASHLAGTYSAALDTIFLSESQSRTRAADTIIHEVAHKNTLVILESLGYINKEDARESYTGDDFERDWAAHEKYVEDFRRDYPELVEKARKLDRLRYEALNALQNKIDNGEIDIQDPKIAVLVDGLNDIHEFITLTLTNKTMMQFLNEVMTKPDERSWMQKIVDAVLDLLTAVAEYMGADVKEGSILKEAYGLAYHFVQEVPHIVEHENSTTVTTYNENDADMIEQAQLLQDRTVQRTDDGTKIQMVITASKNKRNHDMTSTDARVNMVLGKMTRQLDILDAVLGRPIHTQADKENHIKARNLYHDIKKDAETLQANKNLQDLAEIGAKQLKWAHDIMTSKEPALAEVRMASALVSVWKDLNEMHGGKLGEFTPEFKEISFKLAGDAQYMWQQVARFRNEYFIQGSNLDEGKLSWELKEQGLARQMGLGMTRDTNPFIQHLARQTQEARDNVSESRRELLKSLKALKEQLESYAKTHGMGITDVYKKFLQKSENADVFGLVQKLNADWYKQGGAIYSNLLTLLRDLSDNVNPINDKDPAVVQLRAETRRDTWHNYWSSQLSRGVVIDPRLFYSSKTNEKHDPESTLGKKAKAEYDRLVELCGDASVVDEALRDLDEQMEKFREDLEMNKDVVGWKTYNSPFKFMETLPSGAISLDAFKHSGRNQPQFVPFKDSKFFDKDFDTVMNDKDLKSAYEVMLKMSKLFRSYMPPSIANKLHDNFLPILNITDVAATQTMLQQLFQGKIGQAIFNEITITAYDRDRMSSNEVPIRYTGRKLPKKKSSNGGEEVDWDKISIDLPKLFEIFGDMAIHYRYMAPIKDALDVARDIVAEEHARRTAEGKNPEARKGLSKLLQNLEFYNAAMTADQSMNHEGVMTDPRYHWNPKQHNIIKKKVAELRAKLEKIDDEVNTIAMNPGSKTEDDPTRDPLENDLFGNVLDKKIKERKAVEEEIAELTKDVRYVSGSAVGDLMIKFNQMKGMAFNPISAVSNLAQGMMSIFIHAQAFRVTDKETNTTTGDYLSRHLWAALSMMRGNMARSYGSLTNYQGGELSQKIRNVIDKLGLIDVLLDSHVGYSKLSAEEKSAFKKSFDWSAWQRSGDFMTKGAMIIAMMLNKMVTVQENAETKTINLFEALDKDGNWDTERFGENEDWYSATDKDVKQQEWNAFRNRVKAVSLIVFGNQDPNVPLFMKKFLVGRLLGQFRASWVNEGINTRFGDKYYDERLGRTVEGRWKTYGNLKNYGVPLLFAQVASIFTGSNPFEGVQSEQTEIDPETGERIKVYRDIQDYEIENMRKNLAGIAWTVALTAAILLIRATLPSEEERRKRARKGMDKKSYTKLMINILTRSQQDLLFYSSPSTAMQLLGTPIPSATVITDVMGALSAYTLLLGDDKDKYEKWFLKQTKAVPGLNNLNKWEFYMNREISNTHRG